MPGGKNQLCSIAGRARPFKEAQVEGFARQQSSKIAAKKQVGQLASGISTMVEVV
jgi:hypothetical protein